MTYPSPQPGAPVPGAQPYPGQPSCPQQYPQPPSPQGPQGPYPPQAFPQQPPAQAFPQQPHPQHPYPYPPHPQPWGGPAAPMGPPVRRGGAGRVVGCLAVGLVLLAVTAGGGLAYLRANRHRSAVPASVAEKSGWDRVADGLTKALAAKDEEAFVRPFAAGPVREKQRLVFRNLLKIPWETARWEIPSAPLDGRLWVNFVHQVKGVDNLPIAEEYGWQVLPVGAGAEVVTDAGGLKGQDGKNTGFGYYPAPWDLYDDLAVQVRDHLVVMADRGQAAELDRDVDVLARAAKDDLTAWQKSAPAPAPAPTSASTAGTAGTTGTTGTTGTAGAADPVVRRGASGFFVVLEKNREVYNKLYRGDGKPDDSLEAGVNMPVRAADARRAGPDEMLIGGSRIVMDTTDGRFTSSHWQDGVTDIGRHEMAHAIVAPLLAERPEIDGTGQPHDWVAEGFAEFMALRGKDGLAHDELAADLREVHFDDRLPGEQGGFYASTAAQRSANYTLGGDAMRYMASKYGEAKVFGFVAAHYGRPSEYAQQLTAATGQSVAQFQAAWAAHVHQSVQAKR